MLAVIQDLKNWDNLDKGQPKRLPMEAVVERWTKEAYKICKLWGIGKGKWNKAWRIGSMGRLLSLQRKVLNSYI